jgi:hypothetical protein
MTWQYGYRYMDNIIAVAGDPGGANALAPIIEALTHDPTVHLHPFAYNEACTIWRMRGIDFETLPENFQDNEITRILQDIRPRLLLAATSYNTKEYEKYFIKAARDQNIPSLSILDFWALYSVRFNDEKGNLVFLPDRIAVMDEQAKMEMIGEGFEPEKLVITGQPAFDELKFWKQKFNHDSRKKIHNNLGIHKDNLIVVFVSEPYVNDAPGEMFYPGYRKEDVLNTLIEILDEINDQCDRNIVLVIRPHPRENPRDFDKYKGLSIRVIVSEEDHSRNIVMSADLVSGMTSNLLVESCYLGCIVVSLQPNACTDDPVITNRSGHSIGVFDKKYFKPVIQKLLLDTQTRKEMKQKLASFQTDGKAVQRIVNIIHSMIKTD